MPDPLRILVVGGVDAVRSRLVSLLAQGLASCHAEEVAQVAELPAAVGRRTPDALVCHVPAGVEGLEAFRWVQSRCAGLPVVVVCDAGEGAEPDGFVQAGAQDCLGLAGLAAEVLGRAVRLAVLRHRRAAVAPSDEPFFRLITENLTDLVAVLDCQGQRLYNSPSYQRTFGGPGALPGTDSFAEIHPEDKERIRSVFLRTVETGRGETAEYRLLLANGQVRHIESVGNVIRDVPGVPDRVVVVSRDVTERRETVVRLERALAELREAHAALRVAQQRLVDSEKVQAVSTFAGAIAHEVKNPLQTLLLGLDYFRAGLAPDDAATESVLKEMENAAHRADAVIRGMVEFAAYGRHEVGAHDLGEIVQEALQAVQTELKDKSVRVSTDYSPGLPRVNVDSRKVRHVFIKLVLGAIQAMQCGGSLTVRTWSPAGDASGRERVVIAELEDDGQGLLEALPEGKMERSFGSAVLRKAAIDLVVVRKVAELFGGRVVCGAREEGGARIAVSFRAVQTGGMQS